MPGYYQKAAICKNGHLKKYTLEPSASCDLQYCDICGAEIITTCPSCGTYIRGKYYVSGVADLTTYNFVPAYCYHCGLPFPWTQSALDAIEMALDDDDALNSDEKTQVLAALPDIMHETPKTLPASNRLKRILGKTQSTAADIIVKTLTAVACEAAKQILGFH